MPKRQIERKLKVAVIEDDPDYVGTFKETLEHAGITVVAILKSIDEVMQALEDAILASVHAVFVDGNLTKGKNDGSEGVYVAKKIREKYPNLVIIGNSASPFPDQSVIDFDFGKRLRLSYEDSKAFLEKGIYDLVKEKNRNGESET